MLRVIHISSKIGAERLHYSYTISSILSSASRIFDSFKCKSKVSLSIDSSVNIICVRLQAS